MKYVHLSQLHDDFAKFFGWESNEVKMLRALMHYDVDKEIVGVSPNLAEMVRTVILPLVITLMDKELEPFRNTTSFRDGYWMPLGIDRKAIDEKERRLSEYKKLLEETED